MKQTIINKKGQFDNYFVPIIFLFAFGIVTILSYWIISSFFSVLATTSLWTPIISSTSSKFVFIIKSFDWIVVVMLVSFLIALALTSWKINTAKAFFIISFIMGIFLGFIGYILSFAFGQLMSEPSLSGFLPFFPRTLVICTNLHWVALACYTIGSISLYAKKEIGGEFVQ